MIHDKCQKLKNQFFTSLKNFYHFSSSLIWLFSKKNPLIICIHCYLLPILFSPKEVRLYITKNIHQLVFLLDHMKPFSIVKNRAVTLNRAIHSVQSSLRQPLQINTTNSILHYVTCNKVQSDWIEQTVLIFSSLNIKIRNNVSYPIPPLCKCPKIIHMLGDLFLCLLILFKA